MEPQEEGGQGAPAASLTDFVASVVGEGRLRVEESFGGGYVRLRVPEAERRQAKHDIRCVEDVAVELMRNARDAGARRVFLAAARSGAVRELVCVDDGAGMPRDMRERVFEARVTSKLDTMSVDRWGVHGRGMALFSIRENALEARVCATAPGRGASVLARLDCAALPERADQSSWPKVGVDSEGAPAVLQGPRNIARAAVEFALDARPLGVTAYLGSPAEVLATLVALGAEDSRGLPPWREGGVEEAPVWLWPSLAQDAAGLVGAARALGLAVSERSAYRVLSGETAPLRGVLELAGAEEAPRDGAGAGKGPDLTRDMRGLKLTRDDIDELSRGLAEAFSSVGERYYVSLSAPPRIRVGRDQVTVTFKLDKG